jgi:hypothetical protein
MSKMSPEEEEAVQAEFAQLEREARGEVSPYNHYPILPRPILTAQNYSIKPTWIQSIDGRGRREEAKDRGSSARCTFDGPPGGYGRGVRGGSGQAEQTAGGGSKDDRLAQLRGPEGGNKRGFTGCIRRFYVQG